MLRYMRTTQERRATQTRGPFLIIDEYHIRIRASRNIRNLTNCWEDIYRRPLRNWKEHRSNQWLD